MCLEVAAYAIAASCEALAHTVLWIRFAHHRQTGLVSSAAGRAVLFDTGV
jgi:hypothetical protein